MDLPPETITEIRIFDWLTRNNIMFWHNRKIKILQNKNIFSVSGKEKPDLIIYSRKLNKYIAVEIKSSITNKNIYDAKIITYQKNYLKNKTQYFIDNKKIEIGFFVIATEQSEFGKLFYDDNYIIYPEEEWQKILSITKREPKTEYLRTKQFLRNLWSQWRQQKRGKEEPGIGILLSTKNDCACYNKPKIFSQEYSNNRWWVIWEEI